MPLEVPDQIDMIVRGADDRLQLIITDAGVTSDPDERLRLLSAKVSAYVAFVKSHAFKAEHPGRGIDDCEIVVMTRVPPTEAMSNLPRNEILLSFKEFDLETTVVGQPEAETAKTLDTVDPAAMLFKASVTNNLPMMKQAVEEGAQINRLDPLGQFPIEFAVHHGNNEMLEYLLDVGADFPDKTAGGRTLWISAHAKGFTATKETLTRQGVKPRLLDRLLALVLKWKSWRR